MSFRKIRPSFGDQSSASTNPSQSTSESTGSDPRWPRSEKEALESSASSSSKRRRVPESVTRNACLNCKKARAKCDGKKPCKRCATRVETSECIYEIHIKHAKEELVKQIKELKAKDHLTEQILQALSTDEKVPEILERLQNGETYESIVEWLGRSPVEDLDTFSPLLSQYSILEVEDHEMGGTSGDPSIRWTPVTSDPNILHHLFQLYFSWIHPVHTLFHEGNFVNSYTYKLEDYCSVPLVNAICALACHLHAGSDSDLEEVEYSSLKEDFTDAVCDSLDADDKSITTVQAFAVMFLVDCAGAHSLRASSYLRVATLNLASVVQQDSPRYEEVWKNTVRGVRNLNIEWGQVTFQVPPRLDSAPYERYESGDDKLDEAKWFFYRYAKDQVPSWPGLVATTNREKSKLMVILQDVVTMMYAHQGPPISARNVLRLYGRLLSWRNGLPNIIGNIEKNAGQALPHVLSLLILYSSTVVQLLRPLLDLERFPSTSVEEVIWNHAQTGLLLLDAHYRTQYTCRYQPALQMFAVLHLTDLIARFFPGGTEGGSKDGPEAVQFGLEALMQSRAGFPVAGPLQEMLRKTSNECGIRLPKNVMEAVFSSVKKKYRINDFIDACTRPTYVQPVSEIQSKYVPSFASEWAVEGAAFGFGESPGGASRIGGPSAEQRGAQSLMQIRNLLNTS